MAIIVPQEEEQTVNPPHLQAEADETTFGGGPGIAAENEAQQKIAESTNEIATFEKIRADQTAVQGATAQLTDKFNQLINDPKTGLPAYQGVNAMEGHDKVLSDFKQTANELAKNLQPDQQGAFNRIAIDHAQALDQHAMGYVRSQLDQHDTNTFKASVNNMTQAASNSYGNPQTVNMFAANIDKIAGARAARLGLDPDETKAFMQNVHSQFHESVLSQMVDDPNMQTNAQAYFAAHKDQMDVDTRERVQKWLGDGSVKSQANEAVAALMAQHKDSESGFLDAADKIQDPDVRTMVRQLGSAQFQQNRAAEKNDQEQVFNNAQDRISKSGVTDPILIRQMITPTEKAGMSGAQYTALQKTGQDIVTSPSMWIDYMESVKNGSISSMSKADLNTKFLQYASPSDQKTIAKSWADGQKGEKALAPTKSFNTIAVQAAVDAKIVPSNKSSEWDDDTMHNYKAFSDRFVQQIEATEQATGKKLSPANQIELANKLVIDHSFAEKHWYGNEKAFVPFADIPETYLSNVRRDYPTATADQITKSYSLLLSGDKAGAKKELGQ